MQYAVFWYSHGVTRFANKIMEIESVAACVVKFLLLQQLFKYINAKCHMITYHLSRHMHKMVNFLVKCQIFVDHLYVGGGPVYG